MTPAKARLAVVAAIIQRNGEVLLARRAADSHLGGHWEFPGGKIEAGESPEQCLARELHEEFELEATIGVFVGSSRDSYQDRELELLAYEATVPSTPKTLNDHDKVRWVPVDELLDYKLAPADIPIAEGLIRNNP